MLKVLCVILVLHSGPDGRGLNVVLDKPGSTILSLFWIDLTVAVANRIKYHEDQLKARQEAHEEVVKAERENRERQISELKTFLTAA